MQDMAAQPCGQSGAMDAVDGLVGAGPAIAWFDIIDTMHLAREQQKLDSPRTDDARGGE